MEKPLISVIIPAHNSASTIQDALFSMTHQTYKNIEILVIDDMSTDNTQSIVQKLSESDPRIHYYKLPHDDPERINKRGRNINAGYMARNYGFEKAQGDYITFQDADDASFNNRIEVQYDLLTKHNAIHVVLDWQKFDVSLLNKKFDARTFLENNPHILTPQELEKLAKKTRGLIHLFPKISKKIDFEKKRIKIINKLFFRSLQPYPGTGNSPLFKREVMETVQFRKLAERIWPSFTGRGADRDFNFQVALTFKNSYVFKLPLYLWRSEQQNPDYKNVSTYIL